MRREKRPWTLESVRGLSVRLKAESWSGRDADNGICAGPGRIDPDLACFALFSMMSGSTGESSLIRNRR